MMYAPGNWPAWLADGGAHANLAMAMWLVALAWRSVRLADRHGLPAGAPLRRNANWCCAGALLNCVIAVVQYRLWLAHMGYAP